MKKFKIVLFFLLVIAVAIIVWSNWDFFSTKHSLEVNLIKIVYQIPAIANGLFLFGCFVVGYLFATFRGLVKQFQAKKAQEMLKGKVTAQLDNIASLKKEVEFLKRNNNSAPQQDRPTEDTEEPVTDS